MPGVAELTFTLKLHDPEAGTDSPFTVNEVAPGAGGAIVPAHGLAGLLTFGVAAIARPEGSVWLKPVDVKAAALGFAIASCRLDGAPAVTAAGLSDQVNAGEPGMPVPLTVTARNPPSLWIVMVPLCKPGTFGANVRFSVQVAPGSTVPGETGQPLATPKAPPLPDIPVIVSGALPLLVTTKATGAEVLPTAVDGNAIGAVGNDRTGAVGATACTARVAALTGIEKPVLPNEKTSQFGPQP